MDRYGFSLETLSELISRPRAEELPWGRRTVAARRPEYELERIELDRGGRCPLTVQPDADAAIFVEAGRVTVGEHALGSRDVLVVGSGERTEVAANEPAVLYVFSGPAGERERGWPRGTFDRRKKYWGTIETVVNSPYAGKRLFFRKGQHSSLHFHCEKTETYFIHSGKLLVRLRAGRGEDRFFELAAGQTLLIPPGLMHQDGGVEDTVVIEASTHDEDADTFIVEDGQTHPMPRFAELIA